MYLRGTAKANAAVSTTTLAKRNAIRIDRLNRQVNINRAELKQKDSTVSGSVLNGAIANVPINTVVQGDDDAQRDGRRIKIYKLTVRLHVDDKNVDGHIVLSPHAITPLATDFHLLKGGMIKNTSKYEHKCLRFLKNYGGANGNSAATIRFKRPLIVRFYGTGASDLVSNLLSVCVVNASGLTAQYDVAAVIHYTDA